MFRDYQIGYIFASVALVLIFIGVAAWYETSYKDGDSLSDTVAAVLQWVSPAVALTVTILGVEEIIMVLAARYRKRRDEEVRQEARLEARKERDQDARR
jgi:hypothetical protein